MDVSDVERRVDRIITASIPVSAKLGGLDPTNYLQVMEFAKAMSTCRAGIPKWLRGSYGDCLMITTKAMRMGMDPFFVAEQSYMMENQRTGEVKIGYQSQLIHAMVESLAPLKKRLRHEIIGTGDDRYCEVYGTFEGEDLPHKWKSEPLGKRIKDIGKSDKGTFRGSPLWFTKPELQLFYDASRDWARMHCPDVLAGVYSQDELTDMEPIDVTPKPNKLDETIAKLKASKIAGAKGFDPEYVRKTIIEGTVNSDDARQEESDAVSERSIDELNNEWRQDEPEDRGDGDRDQAGSGDLYSGAATVRSGSAGQQAAPEEGQEDIFPPDRGAPQSAPQPKTKR